MNVGTFGVNRYVPDLGPPWATWKASGLGSRYGPGGLDAYLQVNPYSRTSPPGRGQ